MKVVILYVEAKGQQTEVRTQPLDGKSLANHVGAVINTNAKCLVGYGVGNDDVRPKGSKEDGGVIYDQTFVSEIVRYTFGLERRSNFHENAQILRHIVIAATLLYSKWGCQT